MVGPVSLALDAEPPAGVTVRVAGRGGHLADDARRAEDLQARAFGRRGPGGLFERVRDSAGRVTLWLAEADDELVGVGRLDLVPGTPFAGLWGGATDPYWRGRGVYRALTAARAAHAAAHGVRMLHSDCLPTSRPILERAGLRPVTTTTPYVWRFLRISG